METDRETLLEALRQVALSKANDAIALALGTKAAGVKDLDLWCVSEFKASSTGSVEIKFTDRVKALSLLLDRAGGEDGMRALLSALEDSEEV